jgi:hypothetical protein
VATAKGNNLIWGVATAKGNNLIWGVATAKVGLTHMIKHGPIERRSLLSDEVSIFDLSLSVNQCLIKKNQGRHNGIL